MAAVSSIEVEKVSKQFNMRYQRTLKQVIVAKTRGQKTSESFWALQDVSFTVGQGEAIVSGLLLADVPGVLASWRAQGFDLAERIELEGWASLRLRR